MELLFLFSDAPIALFQKETKLGWPRKKTTTSQGAVNSIIVHKKFHHIVKISISRLNIWRISCLSQKLFPKVNKFADFKRKVQNNLPKSNVDRMKQEFLALFFLLRRELLRGERGTLTHHTGKRILFTPLEHWARKEEERWYSRSLFVERFLLLLLLLLLLPLLLISLLLPTPKKSSEEQLLSQQGGGGGEDRGISR